MLTYAARENTPRTPISELLPVAGPFRPVPMFNISREREETERPLISKGQPYSSLRSQTDEWALDSSIRELYCEMDDSRRSVDPSIPTPRTPLSPPTEATLWSSRFSSILDDDCCELLANNPDTPCGDRNQFLCSRPVHSLPHCCAPQIPLAKEHSSPYLDITPPLAATSYRHDSSEDELHQSTSPWTPRQDSQSYHIETSTKLASFLQTPCHARHPVLLVQESAHCDASNNDLCCCDDYLNSEVSLQRSGSYIGVHPQTIDAPAVAALSKTSAKTTPRLEAPRHRLDGALARLSASLDRERRLKSGDGPSVDVERSGVLSNINFTSRLIPRNLLNIESGESSWIGNVYRQAAKWILEVRLILYLVIASNRLVPMNR